MDKEQFDHIEHFFRQAAENVSPPANEEAWRKMEALLDDEFNKKRRRGIFWWWPLILFVIFICAGIFYLQGDRNNADQPPSMNTPEGRIASGATKKNKAGINAPDKNRKTETNLPAGVASERPGPTTNGAREITARKITGDKPTSNSGKQVARENISENKKLVRIPHNKPGRVYTSDKFRSSAPMSRSSEEHVAETRIAVKQERLLKSVVEGIEIVNISTGVSGPVVARIPATSGSLPLNVPDVLTNSKKKPSDNNQNRSLYFLASGSYDASAVGKIKLDNFNVKYGVGIGYHISKRLGLQTGFYAAKKLYSAGDGDYKVKPDSYISKILTVNADCFFYDVPLSLRYDVLQRKNYNIYAVAGLSSYWSKRETYDYHFLNRNGMYRSMVSTVKNNTDFLSVLNVSTGFEYALSKSLYLQAEPYINVPLAGLGEGSVKLYSAGLQMGIKYQPLKKKKVK